MTVIVVWVMVIIFGAAMNAKALGSSVVAVIGMMAVSSDGVAVSLIGTAWVLSLVLSGFRG